MFNREIECMEQYPYQVVKMNRARGGVICHCEEGTFLLKEYNGNEKRIQFLSGIQRELEKRGFLVDTLVPGKEGLFIGTDSYGGTYTLRKWINAKECDATKEEEILCAAEELAKLTKAFCELSKKMTEEYVIAASHYAEEVIRHNRELKGIRNYVKSRRKRNEFEEIFQKLFQRYYEQGLTVAQLEEQWDTTRNVRTTFCHRDFTHHNVFLLEEEVAIVHFDNLQWGSVVTDLSLFLRKIMEKNAWDCALAQKILQKYTQIMPLNEAEYKQLYLRIVYPMRFLKVVNHYSSTKKSWVSMRDCEKLLKLDEQEALRQQFLVFLREFVV